MCMAMFGPRTKAKGLLGESVAVEAEHHDKTLPFVSQSEQCNQTYRVKTIGDFKRSASM
jgi:hypothetical protein